MNRNSTDLFTFVTKKQDLDVLRKASIKRREPGPQPETRISNSTQPAPQKSSTSLSSLTSIESRESRRTSSFSSLGTRTAITSASLHDFEHRIDMSNPPAQPRNYKQGCSMQGSEEAGAGAQGLAAASGHNPPSTPRSKLHLIHGSPVSPDLSSSDDDNGFIAFIPTNKMGNSSVSTLQGLNASGDMHKSPSLKSVIKSATRSSRVSSSSSSTSRHSTRSRQSQTTKPPQSSQPTQQMSTATPPKHVPVSATAPDDIITPQPTTCQPPALPNGAANAPNAPNAAAYFVKGPHRRTEGGHMMWDGLTTVSDSSSKLSLSRQTSNTSVATARSGNSARSVHSSHSRQSQKAPVPMPAPLTTAHNKRKSYKPVTKKSTENLYYNYFTEFINNSKESDSLIYAATRREAWIQYQQSAFEGYQSDIAELWGMMALRFILHGALLFSPGSLALRNSSDTKNVLEFQGITKEQWSWQLAFDFPDAMVYGYEWQLGTVPQSRGGGGPANYIQVTGKSLDKLPFSDNYFDIISAKCLWYLIQSDQWVPLFKELKRVLKPGGYIETLICDFAQINPNPLEEKYWSRLTNALRARRMHIEPSQHVASHLNAAGFHNINRAYTALPRAWGGRVGDLTDLLTMFFSTTLMIHFGNLNTEERKDYCRLMADRGSGAKIHTAYKFMACYAQKPE